MSFFTLVENIPFASSFCTECCILCIALQSSVTNLAYLSDVSRHKYGTVIVYLLNACLYLPENMPSVRTSQE